MRKAEAGSAGFERDLRTSSVHFSLCFFCQSQAKMKAEYQKRRVWGLRLTTDVRNMPW